jgi:hypothetical protein
MSEKPGPDLASQMKEARELLEEGEVRDALVLAMDVLWRELDQLRGTLGAIQESLPPMPDEDPAGSPQYGFAWPDPLSYLLH